MDRQILHVDMNGFYASVEMIFHPEARNVPMAVGGDAQARHGVILAKNELAKHHKVATGDAVVEIASENGYNGGYGHQVLLNHEFGYKTRYAHLSDVLVKPGDTVVRGQIIARTGNTGRSTGPHLHYEVIHKGVPVNPINYFNRDMTAEEYERLMENLRETNFEKY